MLDKLDVLVCEALNETLTRKQFDKIKPDLMLGTELEIIHEDFLKKRSLEGNIIKLNSFNIQYPAINDYDKCIKDIQEKFKEVNHLLGELRFPFIDLSVMRMHLANKIEFLYDELYGLSDLLSNFHGANISYFKEDMKFFIQFFRSNNEKPIEEWDKRLQSLGGSIQEFGIHDGEDYRESFVDNFGILMNELHDLEYDLNEEAYRLVNGVALGIEEYYLSDNSDNFPIEKFEDILDDHIKNYFEERGGIVYTKDREYKIWSCVNDASIKPKGVELVSPVMDYETFMTEIPWLVDALKHRGFYANNTCGFHIGISDKNKSMAQRIRDNFEGYIRKGYNALTAAIMITSVGYEQTFHKVPTRMFNGFCLNIIDQLKNDDIDIVGLDLKSLLYDKKYDRRIRFIKYADLNITNTDYLEVRVLGGNDGFDILKDDDELEDFLYKAVSQIWSGLEIKDHKYVVKTMRKFQRVGEDLEIYRKKYIKTKSGFSKLTKKKDQDSVK